MLTQPVIRECESQLDATVGGINRDRTYVMPKFGLASYFESVANPLRCRLCNRIGTNYAS